MGRSANKLRWQGKVLKSDRILWLLFTQRFYSCRPYDFADLIFVCRADLFSADFITVPTLLMPILVVHIIFLCRSFKCRQYWHRHYHCRPYGMEGYTATE
jgi:hypothetical protein